MPNKADAEALALITAAGDEGITYNQLKEKHLHGAPVTLFNLGMIHRKRRKSDNKWVYCANKRPVTR